MNRLRMINTMGDAGSAELLSDKPVKRVSNFNAGPAALPGPVLEKIQEELFDFQGSGLSVLEMSHRSREFGDIAERAEANLRRLLNVPKGYTILFMQGGASAQFSLCVQNLDVKGQVAYADTGYWSHQAMTAARALSSVGVVTSCKKEPLITVPDYDDWADIETASFLHVTDNETIDGIALHEVPSSSLPLVCDMSSSILSKPIDIERYGMIYAGAQKNIGPAGVTVVIVRDELIERSATRTLPSVFSYAAIAQRGSMLNTPPTFAWYAAGLVFQWLLDQGGLQAMAERNEQKAQRLYAVIDEHELYSNEVHPQNRSLMNVPFRLTKKALTDSLLAGAAERGIVGLKGHKSVGGLRVSLYNAVTLQAVDSLVEFLHQFAEQNA